MCSLSSFDFGQDRSLAVPFFKRNKNDSSPEDAPFRPQPDKARQWFDRGQTMMRSGQTETALIYYATGIALDPENMDGHNGMLKAAIIHRNEKRKRLGKGDLKELGGHPLMAKMAEAEALWMSDLDNGPLAIKALAAAAEAEQEAAGQFLSPHVLAIVKVWKKTGKKELVAVMEGCTGVGAWDDAITAGQLAKELDPSDASLDASVKDLSAQRAMAQGGYENAIGEDGSFRSFVKDMDKQRELEEEESIAGVGGGSDRVLDRAKKAFKEDASSPENINKLGTLLRRQGDGASLKTAEEVFMVGFKNTGEYRFRMSAGDIRMQRFKQRIRDVKAEGDDDKATALEAQLLAFEAKEYAERAEQYPTDRQIRYHLGEVALRQGDVDTAMGCFQKSKDEPRLRGKAGHLLGRCFAQEGWHAEAIAEYREVLSKIDATDGDLDLLVRYDMMVSLIEKARNESSEELAREALDICSSIARKDITYRDIRERRHEIDALVKSL